MTPIALQADGRTAPVEQVSPRQRGNAAARIKMTKSAEPSHTDNVHPATLVPR